VEFVRKNFPKIKIIRNEANFGAPKGMNKGIKAAKGEYIAIFCNDTKVDKNWLKNLIEVMESDKKIGACGCKLLNFHKPHIIDMVGVNIIKDGSIYMMGKDEVDKGQYNEQTEVFSFGVCTLFRKKMLDEIGLFDEDFWMHYDEIDLSWRAWFKGWKYVYVPTAIGYHIKSATEGAYSLRYVYFGERNRIWTNIKNMPLGMLVLSFPRSIKRFFYLTKRKSGPSAGYVKKHSLLKVGLTVVKAWAVALLFSPKMFVKRWKMRSMREVSNAKTKELFKQSIRINFS